MVHSKLGVVLSKLGEAEAGAMLHHRPSSRAEAGAAVSSGAGVAVGAGRGQRKAQMTWTKIWNPITRRQ